MPTPARTGTPPELTVAAVIERDGSFMLVEERIAGRLVLNQPAGHVERGETLVAAVIREVLEETASRFIPEATIGVYTWKPATGRNTYLRVAFTGNCTAPDPDCRLDDGIERVLWLSRADLLARAADLRSPMVLRAIDDFTKGIRLPLGRLEGLGWRALLELAVPL